MSKAEKTIQKMYSVTERNVEQVTELMEKFGFATASECVRNAIRELHRRLDPAYLKPSAKEQEREKEFEQKEKFERVTDAEFCEQIKAPIITAETGLKFALLHGVANSIKAIPLLGIKDKLAADPVTVKTHTSTLATKSIEDSLSPYIQELLYDDFAIRIPVSFFEKKE